MKTNLEDNFSKLLETLKDCLQPKDGKPDNRPNCCELLQKINEFSVDKSILTEGNKTYEEFQTLLEKQTNGFLKRFFDNKINVQAQNQQNEITNVNLLKYSETLGSVDGNFSSEDNSQTPVAYPYGINLFKGGTGDIRQKYKFEKRMALFLKVLKVCSFKFC